MKKLICIILISPFLVCDPQPGVTIYRLSGLGDNQTVYAQSDGSMMMDMAGVAIGDHSIKVRACAEPWGCSESSPFSFTRPSLSIPGGIRIGK